jgi:hypothetical protein
MVEFRHSSKTVAAAGLSKGMKSRQMLVIGSACINDNSLLPETGFINANGCRKCKKSVLRLTS